jgi:HTH-type transcriptional regulator, global nitrogen regulator NrpRI
MNRIDERVLPALLTRILGAAGGPLGATRLAHELAMDGFSLQPRMVRNYLAALDARGFTQNRGRAGRAITELGLEQLQRAGSVERIQLASTRMDELAFRMDLDPVRKRGQIILNLTHIPADALGHASERLREVLASGLGLPMRFALAAAGEALCGHTTAFGTVQIGTVCNVTLHGALRAAGIPVNPRFAGLLDLRNGEPVGFSHLMQYEGTTLDPVQLFIKSRLTSVLQAARTGTGCVVAGFREIPAVALPEAERVLGLLRRMDLGGALAIGRPGRPLLGVPVAPGRVGLAITAGLNAIAAMEEAGVDTESRPTASLHPVESLLRPADLARVLTSARRVHQRLAALMEHPPSGREYVATE